MFKVVLMQNRRLGLKIMHRYTLKPVTKCACVHKSFQIKNQIETQKQKKSGTDLFFRKKTSYHNYYAYQNTRINLNVHIKFENILKKSFKKVTKEIDHM